MKQFVLDQVLENPAIRRCELQGTKYFSLIDVVTVIRQTDFKNAQNYYHVFKKRLQKNGVTIPSLIQIKAESANAKFYLTDFAPRDGISSIIEYLTPNLNKRNNRIRIRQDDEVSNFHPVITSFFDSFGWHTEHHITLPSGSQIDVVATNDQTTILVECKPHLSRGNFFTAVGQVMCYRTEFDNNAIPVIATSTSQIQDYFYECCQSLGIRLIALDMLEHTRLECDVCGNYDLVSEKPRLPKRTS